MHTCPQINHGPCNRMGQGGPIAIAFRKAISFSIRHKDFDPWDQLRSRADRCWPLHNTTSGVFGKQWPCSRNHNRTSALSWLVGSSWVSSTLVFSGTLVWHQGPPLHTVG